MKGSKYIPLFIRAEKETGIPAPYLYALAGRESRWNPRKVAGVPGDGTAEQAKRAAVGLFQITRPTLGDYNRAHDSDHSKVDMFDPGLNTKVGAWYLSKIVYPLLPIDWSSTRQIALFTFLWNSGPYGGIRLVESLGSKPTVDDVRKLAQQIVKKGIRFKGLKADSYKWFAKRNTKWVKSVASDTAKAMAMPDFTVAPVINESRGQTPGRFLRLLSRLFRFFSKIGGDKNG